MYMYKLYDVVMLYFINCGLLKENVVLLIVYISCIQ